jgi:hypothetical protein
MTTLATHSGQLERWLGKEVIEHMSASMADWYGPPIAVAGVPGKVFAHRGGDFRGTIAEGRVASAKCYVEDFARRLPRNVRRWALKQSSQANVGFASLSDLISEATVGGKRREYAFQKVGTTGVVAASNSLWRVGNLPSAGAAAAAAPGGVVPTDASAGALYDLAVLAPDTRHFVAASVLASVAPNTLLLYDRLFAVAKAMNSITTEAVTGVPTRYQSTVTGAEDAAAGNFLFVETGTVLAATAHNWNVCTYVDHGGAAGTLPSLTGNSGNIANRLDHPVSQWFAPLAAGDNGIKSLTQMQCSAAVATGTIDFVIGHPLVWMPVPLANVACTIDGINTAFNLVRIFDGACLALLEVTKAATGATTYNGSITTVSG